MSLLKDAESHAAPYVPSLQRTEGQPPPIAANGGLSYMSFDRDGDAGTAKALEDALAEIAGGEGQRVIDMIDKAPPGPIKTRWGLAFRDYDECVRLHPRVEQPQGAGRRRGAAAGLYRLRAAELFHRSVQRHVARPGARRRRRRSCARTRRTTGGATSISRRCCATRGASASTTRASRPTAPNAWTGSASRWRTSSSKCSNFYDAAEVERVFYPEIEKLLLEFFPGATDALVYNHDVFDKDYAGDRTEDQDNKNPGVNARYVNLVHNDLNDNSGRVRCRELLTRNLRNFGRPQHYTEEEADRKMSRRFMSINLAKPMETVEQFPFVLCAWPSFADQPYITNYRIYDDRVGETTRFTYRPNHEWYWFPQQTSTEVSMLKCYDSVTDGSVSRWSFHTACIDPTAPADARCRKNVVVRAYVFF